MARCSLSKHKGISWNKVCEMTLLFGGFHHQYSFNLPVAFFLARATASKTGFFPGRVGVRRGGDDNLLLYVVGHRAA